MATRTPSSKVRKKSLQQVRRSLNGSVTEKPSLDNNNLRVTLDSIVLESGRPESARANKISRQKTPVRLRSNSEREKRKSLVNGTCNSPGLFEIKKSSYLTM